VSRSLDDLLIAGLGPGDPKLCTLEVRDLVDEARRGRLRVFLRTAEHPLASQIAAEVETATAFDDLYSRFNEYDDLYAEMARVVVEAATRGRVAFLVPGSPFMGETAASLAFRDAKNAGLCVRVVPGVSFIEAVACELGVDAVDVSLQIVDAYRIEEAVLGEGAILVAQCHSRDLLSTVKLALLEELPPEHRVAFVDAAYSGKPRLVWVELAELDRAGLEPTHCTSLFVPASDKAPGRALRNFVDLVETLRGPGGCPWDAQQTHHSLSRHLLEETYEVLEAIDALPEGAPEGEINPAAYATLEEELGDLLFQIAFHATLAKEAGAFTIADVARGIYSKLVARHPHVFGETVVSDAAEVAGNWEKIKIEEKQRHSLMDDIGRTLPALLFAHKIQRRATSVGFDWSEPLGVLDKVREELSELESEIHGREKFVSGWAVAPQRVVEELGDLLFAVVNLARHLRVDPEEALRKSAERFAARFRKMEDLARSRGTSLREVDHTTLEELWQEAKSASSD